jgi:hypothetical protein
MLIRRLVAVVVFICIVYSLPADTLIFVAQWDVTIGATNLSWFSANNWWISDSSGNLVPAGKTPGASETAFVTGYVDAGASGLRVQTLTLTNNATVANGTFAVEHLEMLSLSRLQDARFNVLTSLSVGGTNCTLERTTLNLLAIASGAFRPVPPATAATLFLDSGSVLWNAGRLSFADSSQLTTLGPPQNMLVIAPGAVLASTNNTRIRGSAANPLAIDNSGLIRADGGTLTFEDAIAWQSSANLGEFRASTADAQLLFENPMQVPANVTSLFTGPGTSRFLAGAVVDGEAQVGAVDNSSLFFMAGNLVTDDSVTGTGEMHVLGIPPAGSVLTWNNGTFSVPEVDIDSGGELDLSGGSGTTRRLSRCLIKNQGLCALLSPGLALVDGASIYNASGAIFDVRADGAFSGTPMPGGGEFDNAGTFRKSTPGVTTFGEIGAPLGPDFNNIGVVDLQSGGLHLCGGTSSGEYRVGSGAELWFWGGLHVLNDGCALTGSGPVRVAQGVATVQWQVTGAVTAEDLEVGTNATLIGSGRASPGLINVGRLVATENSILTNGNFLIQDLQIKDRVSVAGSAALVSKALTLSATNCALTSSTLSLAAGATGQMRGDGTDNAPSLSLREAATLEILGQLALSDGALISVAGLPQNLVVIRPGGTLSSTNFAVLRGSPESHLVVNNCGVIRVDSETFRFEDAIDWDSSAGPAQFQAADPSASAVFAGPFRVPAWVIWIFTGPGTNRFVASGIIDGFAQVGLQSSTAVLPGNLEVNDTLGGIGKLRVLASAGATGGLVWNNGSLEVASIDIDPGGRMLVAGSSSNRHELAACAINNAGLLIWPGQQLVAGAGAILNIQPGGTLDLQNDATLAFSGSAPLLSIRNHLGTFIKSGGSGSSTLAVDFANSGQFDIRTGTLGIQGTLAQFQGSTTLANGATLSAPTFAVLGGSVSGAGLIDAAVDNSGVFAPGAPMGVLTIAGGKPFHQESTGLLQLVLAGSAAGQQNQLAVGGAAQLDGTLDVQLANGFQPQTVQSYCVLTSTSLTGAFSSITGSTPSGTVWVPRYSSTNVIIALANETKVANVSVSEGVVSFSFSTTPGFTYVVQVAESLNPPDWRTFQTFSGDGLPKTNTDQAGRPQRFYRVQVQ